MRKSILIAIVGCICLLSGCGENKVTDLGFSAHDKQVLVEAKNIIDNHKKYWWQKVNESRSIKDAILSSGNCASVKEALKNYEDALDMWASFSSSDIEHALEHAR